VIALSPIEPAADPYGGMEVLNPGPDFDAVAAHLSSMPAAA
jgi:hypothetical protein